MLDLMLAILHHLLVFGMLAILTCLVLTIACSNVAGMLLARGLERRLLVQLLTEGLALAIAAGALSVPLTSLLVGLLVASQPGLPVPLALELRVDARVHAFAFALAGLAAVASALLPAVQTTRVDVAPALLARARELAADLRTVAFEQADARALPFDDATFDVVVIDSTLSHVADTDAALAEAFRVVRPHGRLAVFDGDYATATVALGEHDPLQTCVDAMMAASVRLTVPASASKPSIFVEI